MMIALETSPTALDPLAIAAPFVVALVIQIVQVWALLAVTDRTVHLLENALHAAGNPPVIDDLLPRNIGKTLTWVSDSLSVFTGILVPGIGILLLLNEHISTALAIIALLVLLGISLGIFVAVTRVSDPSRYLTLFYRWKRLKWLPEWVTPIWASSILVTIITGAVSIIITISQNG